MSVLKKEILLSWPRPFTWESYNITSYHIVCRDHKLYVYNHSIDNTENKDLISATVKLDEGVPDCYKLQCNVTASNALAKSTPAVANISIPSRKFCVLIACATCTHNVSMTCPCCVRHRCVGVLPAVQDRHALCICLELCDSFGVCRGRPFTTKFSSNHSLCRAHCVVWSCFVDTDLLSICQLEYVMS